MRIRFTRRRLLAALAVAVLVAAAVSRSFNGGWTAADLDRIEVGMSRADVERVLGPPLVAQTMTGRVEGGTFIVRLGPGVEPHKDDREYNYAGWQRVGLLQTYSAVVIFDGDRAACRDGQASPGLWPRWRNRIRSLF